VASGYDIDDRERYCADDDGVSAMTKKRLRETPMTSLRKSGTLAPVLLAVGMVYSAGARGGSELQQVKVPQPVDSTEMSLDIGDLITSGAVEPASAVSIDEGKEGCWLLRTSKGPRHLRWYRDLLNAPPDVPDLTIDPKLTGVYDIYVQVRAVDAAGPDCVFPMTFELALDDGSKRELVGVKGFPGYHFDTEVLACHGWPLEGRKLVLRCLGKPVYLYGFRFVPSAAAGAAAAEQKVTRWLATDHVTFVEEPDRHFAFPGAALLKNGDLAVVYREGTVHGVERIGKVSLSRSVDGGRTWLPRVTALDRPDVDDRDPSLFQMSDGMVLLTSPDCLSTSTDGGKTWSEPRPTPVFGPKGPVEDEEGNIVYGGLQRVVQREFTQIRGRSALLQANAVYRSADKASSWEAAGLAAYTLYLKGAEAPLDYIWYDEPFMCVVPHKFWVFSVRVDLDGFARIIRSPDRGKTWEPIIKTPVWGYPQHLLPLRDGRLLMTYGYRCPPWGIRACLSGDNGKTWDIDNEIILRMDGGTPEGQERKVIDRDLGYPVSVQLDDGTIFTVYYHNTAGTNCFIAGTFWRLPGT